MGGATKQKLDKRITGLTFKNPDALEQALKKKFGNETAIAPGSKGFIDSITPWDEGASSLFKSGNGKYYSVRFKKNGNGAIQVEGFEDAGSGRLIDLD